MKTNICIFKFKHSLPVLIEYSFIIHSFTPGNSFRITITIRIWWNVKGEKTVAVFPLQRIAIAVRFWWFQREVCVIFPSFRRPFNAVFISLIPKRALFCFLGFRTCCMRYLNVRTCSKLLLGKKSRFLKEKKVTKCLTWGPQPTLPTPSGHTPQLFPL